MFKFTDDFLIASENHAEHLRHLRMVFERLRQFGLTINCSKSVFGQSEVNYLGYVFNAEGYKPPQHKIDAIVSYPKPETINDMRRFLGMLNYYRRCLPKAAEHQAPLNEYIKESRKNDKRKIQWTPEAEKAFEDCKHSLATVSITHYLSPTAPLVLSTDASDVAIGAVLEQLTDDNWVPVGFFSRKLSKTERDYSVYDRELLAIFAAIKHFQHFLDQRKFIVKTDHKALTYAFSQKRDKSPNELSDN